MASPPVSLYTTLRPTADARAGAAGRLFARAWRRRGPEGTLARLNLLEAACWALTIVIGGAQQWASVDTPSSIDLVSYLDIGDAWWHGHWAAAINGYWNPLYSWILGFVVAVARPGIRAEYPLVEAIDFAIFVCTLASFAWLLRGVRRASAQAARDGEGPAIPDWAWIVGGYALFAWASVRWTTLSSNTPDMLGAALLFLSYGLVIRLDASSPLRRYLLLGAVLGLGYLARTPLFVAGLVLLAMAWWQAPTRRQRRGLLVAAVVFVAFSAPFIAAVSTARGHLTIGDNGRLNHAWLANPRPYIMPNRYWQGGPPGSGTPVHPVRVLWDHPAVYEFSAPFGGTYPAWTDPSYWYEGLTYRFDARAEWATVRSNARFYYYVFGRWMLLAIVAALLVAGRPLRTLHAFLRHARYWLPPVVGLGLYLVAADMTVQQMKLQPPHRYISTFVVLLGLALAMSIRARAGRLHRVFARVGGVALVAASVLMFGSLARDAWAGIDGPAVAPPWRIAAALKAAGVGPGMQIATIGRPDRHEYWARLLRARIVADVPDDRGFWSASPEVRAAILDRLAHAGVHTVVSWWRPEGDASAGWETAPGSSYAIRRLAR